jgi:uncharacterized membrane-anchored protein
MRNIIKVVLALAAASLAVPALAEGTATDADLSPEMTAWLKQLSPRSGEVPIEAAKARLDLGEDYVFYGEQDAKRILTEAWGNPPEASEGVLGMVMPKGTTPFSDSWGAVITFDDVGYVSDADAADVDYDDLLKDLQDATAESNDARKEAGFETIKLVGWAARPVYDSVSHSVVWAKDLAFLGTKGPDTLNYDLRTLGRHGVLSMNLVSTMDQLPSVKLAANELANHASFTSGARYEDYNSATDKEAGYGIAGLIAAGAGVAAAKKLGIFAILLKFLKPIIVAVVVAFGAFRKKVMALFGMKSEDEYFDEPELDPTGEGNVEPAGAVGDDRGDAPPSG